MQGSSYLIWYYLKESALALNGKCTFIYILSSMVNNGGKCARVIEVLMNVHSWVHMILSSAPDQVYVVIKLGLLSQLFLDFSLGSLLFEA